MGLKRMGYSLVKLWIRTGLSLYFSKIKIQGLERVPGNRPVLFLPNHQSALIDVLLLAVDCSRKPYFLTRADVFQNRVLNAIFDFFRMIPIYRIRDGREALRNNMEVFDRCADLLAERHAILLFPEANHNIRRRVRPLSKGFTRIVFHALDKNPELDITLIPVGLNYENILGFPDKVAVYFGEGISVKELYDPKDTTASVDRVKKQVSDRLKSLTVHIAHEERYESIVHQLDRLGVDFLNPMEVNQTIKGLSKKDDAPNKRHTTAVLTKVWQALFMGLNFPVVMLWRLWMKPRIWEPEFTATLRFAFALLVYPVYFALLLMLFSLLLSFGAALSIVAGLFLFNWAYVKLAPKEAVRVA